MFPDVIKLCSVGATESNLVSDQSSFSEVKMDQSHHPQALVGLGTLLAREARYVFASSENN